VSGRVLAVRLDSMGDVVLTGPAVRALASSAEVVYLCSPRGASAAAMLPGVSRVEVFSAPWVLMDPDPVELRTVRLLVQRLHRLRLGQAAIFTSSHQSPLPFALLARLAGIPRVAGISVDHAGALLDVRIPGDPDLHEVERNLLVAHACGARLPVGDDGRLRLLPPDDAAHPCEAVDYVVVHPGADAEARTWDADRWRRVVALLDRQGWSVVVTGSSAEAALCTHVCGEAEHAFSLAGSTDVPGLVRILAAARVVLCGNTGPVHLAAAVGTPVVCVFAPTVPLTRWRPWRVPHAVLGRQDVPCAGCRSRRCPLPTQLCLDEITPEQAVEAMGALVSRRERVGAGAGA
jgi:ADP-heptose:LPS heptosyltransferase